MFVSGAVNTLLGRNTRPGGRPVNPTSMHKFVETVFTVVRKSQTGVLRLYCILESY